LSFVSNENLERLFGTLKLNHLKKGKNIISEGEVCKNIFFLEKGFLRTFIIKEGSEINTDFTFENNFTTNLKCIRLGISSDTYIQAGEETILWEFDKDILLALYKESQQIESFGRNLLEQLLMAQEEHTNLFKIHSPSERYHYLETNKPELIQRVSLSQISSYLGVARETLSRIRKK
jgi:CRP-like cAMP-binding protein